MENSVFGNRIKKLRVDREYSMQELANKINVTKSSINMWENGGSIPKDNILIELSKLFNVSIDYLLGNEKREEEIPENKTLHCIQKNLEKLDNEKLNKAKQILKAVFNDIFEDEEDDEEDDNIIIINKYLLSVSSTFSYDINCTFESNKEEIQNEREKLSYGY